MHLRNIAFHRSVSPRRLILGVVLLSVLVGHIVRAGLVHRYSFDGNIADSIGQANGVLVNHTGKAVFSDGQLILGNDGSQRCAHDNGDYIDLPNGIISALGNNATFEFWVTWAGPAGSDWQEFMSFGTSDAGEGFATGAVHSTYIMLTPRAGAGGHDLRSGYRYGPNADERVIDHTTNMPLDTQWHIVLVWDGEHSLAKLYVNGVFSAQNTIHFNLATDLVDVNNWLGRSQWNDPYFVGRFNEFRIYDTALSAEQIQADFAAGPDAISGFFHAAEYISPPDDSRHIPLDTELHWQSEDNPEISGHNIYVGLNEAAVATADTGSAGIFRGTAAAAQRRFALSGLQMDTTYYWRVDELGSQGQVITGPVWRFHTVNLRASEPNPPDGQNGLPVSLTLSWQPGWEALKHNLYWGTSPEDLQLLATNLNKAEYHLGDLQYATSYYWRVDEIYADDVYQPGPVWHLQTQAPPSPCLAGDINGDCLVDQQDLFFLVRQWLQPTNCSGYACADLDRDQMVNGDDLAILASNWQKEKQRPVIINEIHYHPESNTKPLEFIELFNPGEQPVNLGGWQLEKAISYTFPANTTIPPGGFILVAEDPAALQAEFAIEALGPFAGHLGNEGEHIVLRDAGGRQVDEVEYNNIFPWPISADGEGASLELINPSLDNNLAGSWRPSGYTIPAGGLKPARYLVAAQSENWHYRKGNSAPAEDWQEQTYNEDETWQIGQTSIGYGDNDDNTVLSDMQTNYMSCYLRHEFVLDSPSDMPAELVLNIYVDDGCVVWLNGKEVTRFHVRTGQLSYNPDPAQVDNHESEWESYNIGNPTDFLVIGKNVLAIHAVNDGLSSSDFSIDASLYAKYADIPAQVFGPPTPGRQNSVYALDAPPQIRQVKHAPKQPASFENINITAKVTDPDGVQQVLLTYQVVLPGHYIPAYLPVPHDDLLADPRQPRPVNPAFSDPQNWVTVEMKDDGLDTDERAGDNIFTATIPGQKNRSLLRYRIRAVDRFGNSVRVPYYDDMSLNFACFIYDGVPPYKAQTRSVQPEGAGYVYPSEVMTSLPVYFLLTRREDITECYAYNPADQQPHTNNLLDQLARRAYNWEGALVYEGQVYDHIGYRLRGANGRYHQAGKRSMKFRFNRGRYFQARDIYGKKYPVKWKFLQVGKMFGNRQVGEFGLTEILNMQLWELVGVPASKGHWFHFRVVDRELEEPNGVNGQYYGDFWGLFLALENYDSTFMKARDLPRGNLYKLSDRVFEGSRQLRYQGADAVTDSSDYENIRWHLNASASAEWIQNYLACDEWYRYHAVAEAIRHYDVFSCPVGSNCLKNMAWYFFPDYGPDNNYWGHLWFLPFDTDDTWGPFWNYGTDQAKVAIFEVDHYNNPVGPGKPALKQEYRNYMREFRDLLWQPEVIDAMIDDLATKIAAFVPADRDRWKDAPADAGRMDFGSLEEKVADMKRFAWQGGRRWPGDSSNYIGAAAHLDDLINAEGDLTHIPATPVIHSAAPANYPVNQLVFTVEPFRDPQGNDTFAAMKWRLAEVSDPSNPVYQGLEPKIWEITPVWQSPDLTEFSDTITIPPATVIIGHTYRIRCKMKDNTSRWSHWSAPIQFIVQPTTADKLRQSLRITELMYHPDAPPGSKYDNDEFEFIELKNIGATELDLTHTVFTDGIRFSFADSTITTMAPQTFILLVKNKAAFVSRYGNGLDNLVAGEYDGKLANDGEQITLADDLEGVIIEFRYDDNAPWPAEADGQGYSLVPLQNIIPAEDTGLLNDSGSWKSSAVPGGSPGGDEPG